MREPLLQLALMRAPFVFVGPRKRVLIASMVWVWFVVQIIPKAMRMDGHPCEQVPSGSTTHPSRQQAGDVASHIALRVKSSRVSDVKPSLAKASAAVMR